MILASASSITLILSLISAVCYALPALLAKRLSVGASRASVAVAWLLHGIVASWGLFGSPAYFGFGPALSVTTWLVAAGYAVESQIFPQMQTRWALCGLGAAAVMLAAMFPGSALPTQTSVWLPVHLAFGVASYGLFGTAVVHAWLMTRTEKRIRLAKDPHTGLPLLTLERLTFRFVAAGFALLSATLLIGLLFGDALYGRPHAWRWDHKTVFSVLAWLTFAGLLVGRSALGWRGKRAIKVLYTGATFLLLAYVGSRFVMEVFLGRTP
ncbi:MAG: cytochrome c biogenesis protein CcsA [Rhodoferax sp.]|nr:cytochrome c biogenesis protein CcsA [Rhodoferax sp.]